MANPTLESLAQALGQPLVELALMIYAVAQHLESSGNHAMRESDLQAAGLLPVAILTGTNEALYRGILFWNDDKKFRGWMCRKNPHWLDIWGGRYGDLDDGRIREAMTFWQARQNLKRQQEEARAAAPKRESELWARGLWASFTTIQIGKHYAFANLMMQCLNNQVVRNVFPGTDKADNLLMFQRDVWLATAEVLEGELVFRVRLGDADAKKILHIDDGDLARARKHVERLPDTPTLEAISAFAHFNDVPRLYYTQKQIEDIAFNRVDITGIEPMDPIPAVPRCVHVKSVVWQRTPDAERLYIGRKYLSFKASEWANPYTVEKHGRVEAIGNYEADLRADPVRLARLRTLRGLRILGCWCKKDDPDQPCHGDVLVKYAGLPDAELDRLIRQAGGDPAQLADELGLDRPVAADDE